MIEKGELKAITKRKILHYPFTEHIVNWLDDFDKETINKESWFFPHLQVVFDFAFFDFHRIRINRKTDKA